MAAVEAAKTPRFILLIIEWVFALVAFAVMGHYLFDDRRSSFEYLTAICILVWLVVMIYMVILCCGRALPPLIEAAIFLLFAILVFIAFLVTAVKCNNSETIVIAGQTISRKVCEGESEPKAAAAFAFLLGLLLAGSSVLGCIAFRRPSAPPLSSFQNPTSSV
uniref:CASP-like protein 0U1 n=1 Tax=Chlorokybus atmophyticus TaxID=3144 RepID=CSPL1_CHLAT|nr:RecName: Full=CASP-like protein 0U1; Short=CaCASPL0U1 [Chlorokybus atmophyticus]